MTRYVVESQTFDSPDSATTEAQTTVWDNLDQCDWLSVIGVLTGGTGGTLDVYLQAELALNIWVDWLHFPQLAAAATAQYAVDCQGSAGLVTAVGVGTIAVPGVALAANTLAFAHPGKKLRAVCVAGASTSAGASQTIHIIRWRQR